MRNCRLQNGIILAGLVTAAFTPLHARGADDVVNAAADAPVVAIKPVSNGEAILLKYQFEPNQKVHYKVTQKMSTTLQKGSARQTARSEWTTNKHIRVVSTDAAGSSLETTIDRIQATVQIDDGKAETFDSKSDSEPPAPLKRTIPALGRPLALMQFAPNGKLLKSEILETKDVKKSPVAAEGNEDKSDPNSKSFLITMPETPVKVGDSWKDPFIVNVSIPPSLTTPVTLNRTYTLTSLENGIATIRLESAVITPVNSPAVEVQLMLRTPKGTIQFDTKKGLIISKTLTSDETVHEFSGGGSQMRAENTLVETLAEPEAISLKPSAPAKQ